MLLLYFVFIDDKDYSDNTSSWGQLLRPEVYRPFRLLMVYLFFSNLLAGIQYGPYLISVFTEFGAPVNVELTIVSTILAILKSFIQIKVSRLKTLDQFQYRI